MYKNIAVYPILFIGLLTFSLGCKSKRKLIPTYPINAEKEEKPADKTKYEKIPDRAIEENKPLSNAEINQKIEEMMEKQAIELRKYLKDAEIKRIKNGIQVSFDPGVLFAFDKSNLTPIAKENIQDLAVVLNKFPYTVVLVEGHTDSDGNEDYNMKLSIRRANSFADYTVLRGVDADRFTAKGFGESKPKVSNATPEGRQANRRIDATITASPLLYQKIAKKEQIEFSSKITNSEKNRK
jgi:outer membrane protein OmpA-like peptidoglycan-associated protein